MTWIPQDPEALYALTALLSHAHPHPEAKLALELYHQDELILRRSLGAEHVLTLGSSRERDVRVEDDAGVAPLHMTLRLGPGGWTCQDHDSPQGSTLNGRRFYDVVSVRAMDELGLGCHVLRLLDESLEPRPLRFGPPCARPIFLNVYEQQRHLSQHVLQGKTRVSLGRQLTCDVQLPGELVSRQHVELYLERGSWWARDCGSFNGSAVNHQPLLEPRLLRPGDRLQIGGYEVEFRRDPSPLAQTVAHPTMILAAQEAPAALPLTLRIKQPGQAPWLFRTALRQLTLGRHPGADLVLHEDYISRQHATLTLTAKGWYVTPAHAQAKLYLEGKRVEGAQPVTPGQRLFVGAYEIILLPERSARWATFPLVDVLVQQPLGDWARWSFAQPVITIGRMPQCDLELSGLKVSRLHATLHVQPEGVVLLRDHQSTNGVQVNGSPVRQERVIRPTDIIAIGDHVLRLDWRGSWRAKPANEDAER